MRQPARAICSLTAARLTSSIPTALTFWPRTNGKALMSSDRLTVAFFGVGAPAQPYLDALARGSDAVVTAVCDSDRRSAEQVAAGWGARVFADVDVMLSEAGPDAVWICAPPRLQTLAARTVAEKHLPF